MSQAITALKNCSNNTLANFLIWAKFLTDNLALAGWVKTNDTGQVDFATITEKPVQQAYSPFTYFQIWRMNDALQATKPVFVKIAFGDFYSYPSFQITVGTGSNGAGVITGIIYGYDDHNTYFNISRTADDCRMVFSGDTNRFAVMYKDIYQNNLSMFINIERTKDDAGADTGEGLLFMQMGGDGYRRIGARRFGEIWNPFEYSANCVIPYAGTTAFGVDIGIYPPIFFFFGEKVNAGFNAFGYRETEILQDTIQPLDINGVETSYYATGLYQSDQFFLRGNNNPRILMRFN